MRKRLLTAAVALVLLAAVVGHRLAAGPTWRTLTAHFSRTVGLYQHSDVRILGVRVGEVTRIVPEGQTVRVDMRYDNRFHVPADAQAVLVAPSIVSDRYVQLTPAWTGGPLLANGSDLPVYRTAVPVELDEIYSALDQLNVALGPNGSNGRGALSDLVATGAHNLDGNGALLNSTLTGFSAAVTTLAANRDSLFGTIANLQQLSAALATSDATVRAFSGQLTAVASQLAGERAQLTLAVQSLAVALGQVRSFVAENQAALTSNVADLASITSVLQRQKAALGELLDNAPTALSNLQLAYNPKSGTLDTRDNNSNTLTPQGALCQLLTTLGQPQLCATLGVPAPAPAAPPVSSGSAVRDLTLGNLIGGSP